MIIRIGIWFDPRHIAFGGPSVVLLGTILGLLQDAETTKRPIVIVLNEPGDYNWFYDNTDDFLQNIKRVQNPLLGPMVFRGSDALLEDYNQHNLWKYGKRFVIPSEWYKIWVCRGLPFLKPDLAEDRELHVWGAGVDTDYFVPSKKTQEYFVYFKSQNYNDLRLINTFLFQNYFHFRGNTVTYYNYDRAMLRDQASKSKFCIMLSGTETQGLSALEIMSCDTPLFVLDARFHKQDGLIMEGATSVACMDETCGIKSSFDTLNDDFKHFLEHLDTYTPRKYVLENYSYERSAHILRDLITGEHHKSQHDTEK